MLCQCWLAEGTTQAPGMIWLLFHFVVFQKDRRWASTLPTLFTLLFKPKINQDTVSNQYFVPFRGLRVMKVSLTFLFVREEVLNFVTFSRQVRIASGCATHLEGMMTTIFWLPQRFLDNINETHNETRRFHEVFFIFIAFRWCWTEAWAERESSQSGVVIKSRKHMCLHFSHR